MYPKHCVLTQTNKSYVHPPILGLFKDKEFLKPSAVDVVSLEPPEIKIEFNFGSNESAKTCFTIRNIQALPIRVNILPPQTEFFKVAYKDPSWLFPGLTASAEITFFSKEPRHYTDRIRINCFDRKGEHNVFLPLNVQPKSLATCDFPTKIDWGSIPINKTVDYDIPINALDEGELVFLVQVINCDPDLTITPQQGIITKYDKRIDIKLAYTPMKYVTSIFYVHIHVPAISETPFLIKCYAECKPDCPEIEIEEKIISKKMVCDVSPPDELPPQNEEKTRSVHDLDLALMYMDGVNKLLMKRESNLPNYNELRGPLNWYIDEDYEEFKEHLKFCYWKAKCLRRCNDIQMIRDRPVLGQSAEDISDPERRAEVDMIREILNDVYQSRLLDNKPEYTFGDNCKDGTAIRKRLIRDYKKVYTFTPSQRMNDPWFYKLRAINRFLQAGRKTILKNRLLKNLATLKMLTPADINAIEEQYEKSQSDCKEKVWQNMYKEKKKRIDARKLEEAKALENQKLSAKSEKPKKDKEKKEKKVKKKKDK